MLNRSDRRELGVLGLMLLGFALLVSPVVHRALHQHGDRHQHGTRQQLPTDLGGAHGDGSFEHGSFFFGESPAEGVVELSKASSEALRAVVQLDPTLVARRSVAQAQAP